MADEDQIIETVDENGNVIKFELFDIVEVDEQEYALLLPVEEEEGDEVVLMRLSKDGDEYLFETIDDDEEFDKVAKGYENFPEGGIRCTKCFNLRLEKTAKLAKRNNFDYFTTTLSVSPYKNSVILNDLGKTLEKKYNVKYLYADFKKKDGYKKSIEYSKKYNLYRQHYCGCKYSLEESLEKQI